MKDKGYAMIIDALFALVFMILLFSVLFSVEFSETSKSGATSFKELHYVSEDVIDVLGKAGVLDKVADNWSLGTAAGEQDARYIALDYLENMTPGRVGFELQIEEGGIWDVVCNSSSNPKRISSSDYSTQSHSTRLVVRYGSAADEIGYVARAKVRLGPAGNYSSVKDDEPKGCKWSINGPGGYDVEVPPGATASCTYSGTPSFDSDDAINEAAYNLFEYLNAVDGDPSNNMLDDYPSSFFVETYVVDVERIPGFVRFKLIVWM